MQLNVIKIYSAYTGVLGFVSPLLNFIARCICPLLSEILTQTLLSYCMDFLSVTVSGCRQRESLVESWLPK